MESKFIYEILDYSNEDIYYPMGVFDSLELAIKAVKGLGSKTNPKSWYEVDDYEKISIHKRELNIWNEGGVEVWSIERSFNYELDKWVKHKLTQKETQ